MRELKQIQEEMTKTKISHKHRWMILEKFRPLIQIKNSLFEKHTYTEFVCDCGEVKLVKLKRRLRNE